MRYRKDERYRVGRMNSNPMGPNFIDDKADGVYVLAPITPNAVCRAFSNDTAQWIAKALTEYQAPRNRAVKKGIADR